MKRTVSIMPLIVVLLSAHAAAAGVAVERWAVGKDAAHPKTLRVTEMKMGAGDAARQVKVIRGDLSALPADAKVLRADLWLFRTIPARGADRKALTTIKLEATAIAGGGDVTRAVTRALKPRGPSYDRFDATEAVRAAVRERRLKKGDGGPLEADLGQLRIAVEAFAYWRPEATYLDIRYAGTPKSVPRQAASLAVRHRAGQTFVTFRQTGKPPAKLTWGEAKKLRAASTDRYRVYAHAERITAANLAQAELLGEVDALSGWNLTGRNVEYLIGQAMIKPDKMGELTANYNGFVHTWHMDHPRMDRYPLARLVADEQAGPLPAAAGLYVAHPAKEGRRFHAVTACREGTENTKDFSPANATPEPVAEKPGAGVPVRQGRGLSGPYFDYPGARWVYVQWCGPPMAPRPMAFNWSVLVPPGVEDSRKPCAKLAPAELTFHGGNYSHAKPNRKVLAGSIQIAPHDWPPSGWYGYNDRAIGLADPRTGTVGNHTQRRIVAFLGWAKKAFPVDGERVIAFGSDGAAMLALSHPEQFAYVLVNGFDRSGVLNPKAADRFAAAWGPKDDRIADALGRASWSWAELDKLVAAAGKDLPVFICKGASWGGVKGWGKGRGRFYSAMHKARQPLFAHWAWGGKLYAPDKYTGLWRGLDIRRLAPAPAIANSSLDREGEGGGNTNMSYAWKDVTDTAGKFEMTLTGKASTFDLTPRRMQKFEARPGETLRWEAVNLPGRRKPEAPPAPQSGTVLVDANGVVTIKDVSLVGDSAGVKITLTKQ